MAIFLPALPPSAQIKIVFFGAFLKLFNSERGIVTPFL
jgi:hypothetical protein